MKGAPLMLALDTSHMTGSVAVVRGGAILCEILFDASDTHSATLMPAIDACLATARKSIVDIDLFAVVSGPGSFTGLRIGLATVKGFAAIGKRPIVTVGSLEVLAAALPGNAVVPLVDARRGEVYGAVYDCTGGMPTEIVAPFAERPERIGARLEGIPFDGPPVVCGTGARRYRGLLEGTMPAGVRFQGPRWSIPSAAVLAMLAGGREPSSYEQAQSLEPLYIRPADARPPADGRLLRIGGTDVVRDPDQTDERG